MARPERFELPTYSSGGCRSIQLSYGRVFTVYIEPRGSAEIPRMLSRRVGKRNKRKLCARYFSASANDGPDRGHHRRRFLHARPSDAPRLH